MTTLLALDLATVTGYAFWKTGMERPRYGRWLLPANVGDELERCFLALRRKLRAFHEEHDLAHGTVIIEAPIKRPHDDLHRLRLLIGLANEASTTALELTAVPRDTAHNTMMVHWVGTGYPKKDGWKGSDYGKHLSLLAAKARGFKTDDHNTADALGLLTHYAALWRVDVPWDVKRCAGPEYLELQAAGRIVGGA